MGATLTPEVTPRSIPEVPPRLTPATPGERGTARAVELGIPSDARRVLVLCESSHWDTNWLQTSDEYYARRIAPILTKVVAALEEDPARIYGVESVFFLKLFWERNPEYRGRLRALVASRQLRVLSSSFTTPDTLLPHPEAILRDFHLGQRWLTEAGFGVCPRTAYFPDNFGHSPHLPSLMRAVGVDAIGVTRIDGMHFVASDFRTKASFPLRGSTAETLTNDLKTLDFVWQDDDGAEILCHWNAFTYFQGDMIAHAGIIRWNGHVAAVPFRTRGHVARRVEGFVKQLEPLARTRYLLCPIGMDFNDPITRPRELIDRYNREDYPTTGTWVVLCGLDDYFDLLAPHAKDLPVLSVDPNPYWMGFYASRPELKQRPTRIARTLVLAEKLSAFSEPEPERDTAIARAWAALVLMNHHDAITGTSTDRVCEEQRAWLDAAQLDADAALTRACLAGGPIASTSDLSTSDLSAPNLSTGLGTSGLGTSDLSTPDLSTPSTPGLSTRDLSTRDLSTPDLSTPDRSSLGLAAAGRVPPEGVSVSDLSQTGRRPNRSRWWREGPLIHVQTAQLKLVFSEEHGGCLTSLIAGGREQLGGLGLDLCAFSDDGGLWRLGHEYRGGAFTLTDRASARAASITVRTAADSITVDIDGQVQNERFLRSVTASQSDRFLRVSVTGSAPRRYSVTCRVEVVGDDATLEMDTVGGAIERPRERLHAPTFWPVPSIISLVGKTQAFHVGFEAPTAVSFSPDHALEWIVARNATKERAFGWLPVLAHPIGGTSDEAQTHHAALFVTPEATASRSVLRDLEVSWFPEHQRELKHLARKLIECDDPSVWFAAVKRADTGGGVIVRLVSAKSALTDRLVRLGVPARQVLAAFRCDAKESNIEPLELQDGKAVVPMRARLTTVRLITA